MKQTRTILTVTIIISVFTVCFLIGRASVLKEADDKKEESYTQSGTAKIPIKRNPVAETSNPTDKIEKRSVSSEEISDKTTIEEPPLQMLFPCGREISKPYSQAAVYSKTTDDWRAHLGIDYSAAIGDEVRSICDGVVVRTYEDKLWGNCIEILHTGNVTGLYKNMDKEFIVKNNQKVTAGQVIGKIGQSAAVEKAENPHLHLEIWVNGEPINPKSFVY